jgi:hypothetical protein
MSTYSTNLALELIGNGEQAGNWGQTTNTNLGTLLEQAISGYTTQAITDGADTTLTMTQGASAVARNMYIELTGTLTAARNLIVPSNKKLYFIFNNTTGGFAVTVKVSGQTGVSVANGTKTILVSNGTDIVLATTTAATGVTTFSAGTTGLTPSTATAGAVTLAGTLAVANGGTGSTTLSGAGIVTLTGTQTISGNKTFSGTSSFTGTSNFTGVSGFGITANSNTSVYAKAPNTSGAGFVGVNNGAAVPYAAVSSSTTGALMVYYYGTFPSSVTTNGYVVLSGSGVNYYSASDYRLKSNVAPLSNAVTKLKQLAPKNYTWISHPDMGTVDGFIAHELEAVVPQAVHGEKDAIDENGKPKYQGVDSSNLVPLLTAALQEALVRIEALEAKVG